MSRSTQFIGLNDRAKPMIEGRQVVDHYIKKRYNEETEGTKQVEFHVWETEWIPVMKSDVKTYPSGKFAYGIGAEEIGLFCYKLPIGTILEEVVQETPWSSGPVIFTCLQASNPALVGGSPVRIEESEWTEEEIQTYL